MMTRMIVNVVIFFGIFQMCQGTIVVSTPGNVNVAEDVVDPAFVYTPTAGTDPILWSATITPADGKFRIYYNNGTVYYLGSPGFDHENVDVYTVQLTATDADNTDTATYSITITDVNETPIITNLPATVAVEENWVPTGTNGETIFDLTGTDVDAGDSLTFELDTVVPSSGASYFGLNPSNNLQVNALTAAVFDRETVSQYNLTILLKDRTTGGLTATGMITVDIIDLNETPFFNASVGLEGTVDYDEELAVGTELTIVVPVTGEIRAYDYDVGDVLTYELDGQDQQFFDIRTINGVAKLFVAQRADYETRIPTKFLTMNPATYPTLNVRARDAAGEITEPPFVLTMRIQNKNDNLPVCSPTSYTGTVDENMGAGSTILTVTCSDEDGALDAYEIEDFTTPDQLFEANTTTNALLIKSPPDLERETVLTFLLYAVQGLPDVQTSASVSVTVTIFGKNDNRPAFLQSFYNFDVRYDANIATSVGQLSAVDNDVTTSVLTYDWVSTIHQFRMDPTDGRIRVQAAMTENAKWVLFAVAKDNDSPPDYSDHVPLRIDAFPPAPYLLDFVVSQPISYFTDTRIQAFLDAISSACSPCVGRYSNMISTPGEEATKTTLTVYALVDNTTDAFSNIEVNKYYVPKEDMLAIFTTDVAAGTPSSATTVTAFHSYPVTKVTASISSMTAAEWLTQTGGGIAILTLLSLGLVAAIAGGIAAAVKFGIFEKCMPGETSRQPTTHNIRKPEGADDDLFDYRYKNNDRYDGKRRY